MVARHCAPATDVRPSSAVRDGASRDRQARAGAVPAARHGPVAGAARPARRERAWRTSAAPARSASAVPEFVVVLVSEYFDGVPLARARVHGDLALGRATRWARRPRSTATRRPSSTASARSLKAVREAAEHGARAAAGRLVAGRAPRPRITAGWTAPTRRAAAPAARARPHGPRVRPAARRRGRWRGRRRVAGTRRRSAARRDADRPTTRARAAPTRCCGAATTTHRRRRTTARVGALSGSDDSHGGSATTATSGPAGRRLRRRRRRGRGGTGEIRSEETDAPAPAAATIDVIPSAPPPACRLAAWPDRAGRAGGSGTPSRACRARSRRALADRRSQAAATARELPARAAATRQSRPRRGPSRRAPRPQCRSHAARDAAAATAGPRRPAAPRRAARRYGAIATIRSIGTRARSAIASGTLTTGASVAQGVAQLRQRDHLHEAAAGGLVGGDEVDVRAPPCAAGAACRSPWPRSPSRPARALAA